MPAKKYIVELDAREREQLNALISKGTAPAKAILKARILLKADTAEGGPGWRDAEIIEALDTNLMMVMRVRETFVTVELDAVLTRKKRETPLVPAIFDGEAQATLTALACSAPPEGFARWPSVCLLNMSSSAGSCLRRTSIRSAARLKKRPQTAPDRLLGDPAESQRSLRGRDGGRAGGLHATPRSCATVGLPRRDLQAACRRDTHARADAARTAGAS